MIEPATPKKQGYGNRGKTELHVFPPFPQPLLLLMNKDKKQNNNTTYDDRLHKMLDASSS
jgi:hypothetical protein